MRILALDSGSGACTAGVVQDGRVTAEKSDATVHGQAARLTVLIAEVLATGGKGGIGAVAVAVGPGSFTGLRSALALAHGLACGWGCPVVAVGTAEALEHDAGAVNEPLWVALHSRTGRVFLSRGGVMQSFALDALPLCQAVLPQAAMRLTGNAAHAVAARLTAQGMMVQVRDHAAPSVSAMAAVGLQRLAGALPPLAVVPLYVDAPEAKLPAVA